MRRPKDRESRRNQRRFGFQNACDLDPDGDIDEEDFEAEYKNGDASETEEEDMGALSIRDTRRVNEEDILATSLRRHRSEYEHSLMEGTEDRSITNAGMSAVTTDRHLGETTDREM